MRSCWKCRKALESLERHHINGNHNDSRSFNIINLCKPCHNTIQAICDKCDNLLNCHVKRFQECWYFDAGLPPIHFRISRTFNDGVLVAVESRKRYLKGKSDCHAMVAVKDDHLKITCLFQKIKKLDYPCPYSAGLEGCSLEENERR